MVRTATNSLETMLESQRAADSRTTGERQADLQVAFYLLFLILHTAKESTQFTAALYADVLLQAQCKATGTFTELVTSELHARDSDLANYFFNEGRDQKKAAEHL